MAEKVRVRFAPSPTGYLHIGGARSALFNYLFARHHEGTFVLRIEDTDRSRFVEGALKEIYESLEWLGLHWDEGPQKEGEFGPYMQSQRLDLYKEHARKLLESGAAYRCFCTPERLAKVREEQEKKGCPSGYDRHCRDLPQDQVEKKLENNIPYVIRFKIPQGRTVGFEDLIRGYIEYQSDVLDDLVLIKTDGFPTYHMANVVDDHDMRITHVLRGDEWIVSTPRHVLLYEAFGWQVPKFAHLPVILSPGGGKLSKRKGAASVMDYKRNGYLPEALFNFLSLLGWAPGDDREKMSKEELISAFSLEQVSPKASVLDEKKLEWMNGLYMAERPAESLAPVVVDAWKEKGWVEQDTAYTDARVTSIIELMKARSKKLTDLIDNPFYFFRDPESYDEKAARKNFKPEAAQYLQEIINVVSELQDFNHDELEKQYRVIAERKEVGAGKLIHPTRLAVSGVSFGPGLFELLEVLGKETVLRRLNKAIEFIKGKEA
ncbi:MAG: glutamate--tRNA ligase [Chitinispirillaceae bacterium]